MEGKQLWYKLSYFGCHIIIMDVVADIHLTFVLCLHISCFLNETVFVLKRHIIVFECTHNIVFLIAVLVTS